jgi:hypothetical protein
MTNKPPEQGRRTGGDQPTFSWVRGLEEGTLTTMQLESLEAMIDNGEAESLREAAELLDHQSTRWVGDEPGPQAY